MKKKWIIACSVLALMIAVFTAVYLKYRPETSAGSKDIILIVADDQEKETEYKVHTDADTLSDVMKELAEKTDFTYETISSQYGAYVTAVNGLEADDAKGNYWTIYMNDEYGQYGIDSQPVNDGDCFKLKYEHTD